MATSHLFLVSLVLLNFFQFSHQIPASLSDVARYIHETNDCECGLTGDMIATRIVGGEEVATPNLYPWMVGIFSNGRMHCGGSLINNQYVLTAGHCLNWNTQEELTVILGMHDRLQMENHQTGGIIAPIEKIMLHEDFASDYLHDSHDIGLIKLKYPVELTDAINPVCLPLPGSNYDKKNVMVTGWGRTQDGGNVADVLMKAKLKIMPPAQCRNISTLGNHITDKMLCAYNPETDACQGDSGGPLVYETEKGPVEQIGVVSWGIGCAKPGMPGVYARLTSYLPWVYKHTRDGVYCKNPMYVGQ